MINRISENFLKEAFRYFPCVVVIGPRQVGKTTMVKKFISTLNNPVSYIDMESISDSQKLKNPEVFLQQFEDHTIVIDEVQRNKQLYPVLRSVIDRNRRPGRFILLGSASPDLIRDASESLAGRVAYIELTGLNILEIGNNPSIKDLWYLGGFPDVFLKKTPFPLWMKNFVRTYLEKDLPLLGFPGNHVFAERLWTMLAFYHGGLVNYSELSKSLEMGSVTIKKYLNFLENAFLIRQLQPYYFNIKKRLVKSPKIYIRDSGVLHHLLDIDCLESLFSHHKLGASWEGFVIEQIISASKDSVRPYFYRTHDGSELDLVLERKGKPIASIEIKLGGGFNISRGTTEAILSLNTKNNFIVIKDDVDYLTSNGFRVCQLQKFLSFYLPQLIS